LRDVAACASAKAQSGAKSEWRKGGEGKRWRRKGEVAQRWRGGKEKWSKGRAKMELRNGGVAQKWSCGKVKWQKSGVAQIAQSFLKIAPRHTHCKGGGGMARRGRREHKNRYVVCG